MEEVDYRVALPTLRAAFREDLNALPTQLGALDGTIVKDPALRLRLQFIGRAGAAYKRLDAGDDALSVLDSWTRSADSTYAGERLIAQLAREVRIVAGFPKSEFPTHPDGTDSSPNEFDRRIESVLSDQRVVRLLVAFVLEDVGLRKGGADVGRAVESIRAAISATVSMRVAVRDMRREGATPDEMRSARGRLVSAVAAFARGSMLSDCAIGTPEEIVRLVDTGVELWSAVEARDYPRVVVIALSALRPIEGSATAASALVGVPGRVLALAAALAGAKSEGDVDAALSALADPVGSFRNRRVGTRASTAVVAYVGASGGAEALVGQSDKAWSAFGGLSAPIGLEYAWGTGWKGLRNVGLLVGVLDIGTLISYRYGRDTAELEAGDEQVWQVPEARWDHILAPSARINFGVTERYPLTVGLGWQQAPRLRTLEASERRVSVSRIFLFAGVELTLLTF